MVSIAPIEPIDQPELPKPSPPRRRSPGLEVVFGLVVAVVVTGLGAPVGLFWSWLAPKVELVQTPYGPYPVDGEPEGYFADDGWFMIIGAGVGILIAIAAWIVLRRYRGPVILAGLVVGSAAGAALAAWLGNKIGYAHYLDLARHAPLDTHIFRPAKVRAGEAGLLHGVIPWVRGSLLIQALIAAVAYTVMAGFHTSPTLTHDPDPAVLPADPYHPAYTGYPYGDPAQQHLAYDQAANGQPYGAPPSGQVDLHKPGHPAPGPAPAAQGWPAPGWPVQGEPGGSWPGGGTESGQAGPGPVADGRPDAGPVPDGWHGAGLAQDGRPGTGPGEAVPGAALHPGVVHGDPGAQPAARPEPGPPPGAEPSTSEDRRAP